MLRFITLSFLLFALPLQAAIESYEFESAQIEAEYNVLINELRCLVCQNQNISGSNADLAKDLRKQTYDMLTQGKTPDQVVQYMIDRYGDFVLYRPRLKPGTLLLWFGPFALLALVLWLVIRTMRNKQDLAPPKDDALQRAKQLLSDNQENS